MKFIEDERNLAFNISRTIPKEHQRVVIDSKTKLIGKIPNIKSYWMGSDNPNSYDEHIKKYGESWKYYGSKSKITYIYNEYGHRTNVKLNNLPNEWGLALGCSGTEGPGLELKDLWHQKLGLPVYNAGVSGAGNDLSLHNMQRILRIAKPKYIFFQLTALHRYFILNDTDIVKTVGIWDMLNPLGSKHGTIVKESIENQSDYNRTRSLIDVAQTLADLAGSKIIFLDAYSDFDPNYKLPEKPAYINNRTFEKFPLLSPAKIVYATMGGFDTTLEYDDLARDCFHVGSTVHDEVADKIKNLMES